MSGWPSRYLSVFAAGADFSDYATEHPGGVKLRAAPDRGYNSPASSFKGVP